MDMANLVIGAIIGVFTSILGGIILLYYTSPALVVFPRRYVSLQGKWKSETIITDENGKSQTVIETVIVEKQRFGLISGRVETAIPSGKFAVIFQGQFISEDTVRYWFCQEGQEILDNGVGIFKLRARRTEADGASVFYGVSTGSDEISFARFTLAKLKA